MYHQSSGNGISLVSKIGQKQIATEKLEDVFNELGIYSPHSAIEAAVSNEISKN